jgi:hypothetical protein
MMVSGGSGSVGLTKTVLEVEGMLEVRATTQVQSYLLGFYGLTAYRSASHQ